jgi:F-type H+-transporting ATPase subunit delta
MSLAPKQYAEVLINICEGKKKNEIPEIINVYLKYIYNENDWYKIKDILRKINIVWKEKYGISSIVLESAHDISEQIIESINSTSKGADIKIQKESSLIGGIRLRVDDRIIDSSISGQLDKMKKELM